MCVSFMHSPSKARFSFCVAKLKMRFLLFANNQPNSIETINYAVLLQLFTPFIFIKTNSHIKFNKQRGKVSMLWSTNGLID